jgi:ABC-type transport system involved in multi-copper enzyme maturation permease subunit
MSLFSNFQAAAWRRTLSWSDAQRQRLCLILLLGAAVTIWATHEQLPLVLELCLWGLLVAVLALLERVGWLRLLGPVFLFDLVRTTRKTHLAFHRFSYSIVLLTLLFILFISKASQNAGAHFSWEDILWAQPLPAKEMPLFTQVVFYIFIVIQFAAIFLLTPSYVAGAVAAEKERRILEFVLATDLDDRELILGKLASRLATLLLFIFTSLPILSLMQLWGGIEPGLLLACYAASAVTACSIGAVSMLNSVYALKANSAIGRTFFVILTYLFFPALSRWVSSFPWIDTLPLTVGESPFTVHDLLQWINSGNIFTLWSELGWRVAGGGSLDRILPTLLREYVLFHGVVALACTTWAVVRLRPVARQQAEGAAAPAKDRHRRSRPPVGKYPVLWKEMHAQPAWRRTRRGRVLAALAFLLIGGGSIAFFYMFFASANLARRVGWSDQVNFWMRTLGTLMVCGTLLLVLLRSSTSLTAERERQTLDALLTTPLENRTILLGKWLGSILSLRWSWVGIGLFWLAGIALGGLHPLAVPLLVAAVGIYAVFLANLGLWWSTISPSSQRASFGTFFSMLLICFGHWMGYLMLWIVTEREWTELWRFEAFGLTPPITLGFFAIGGELFLEHLDTVEGKRSFLYALLGLACYGAAALVLWRMTNHYFVKRMNRGRIPQTAVSQFRGNEHDRAETAQNDLYVSLGSGRRER